MLCQGGSIVQTVAAGGKLSMILAKAIQVNSHWKCFITAAQVRLEPDKTLSISWAVSTKALIQPKALTQMQTCPKPELNKNWCNFPSLLSNCFELYSLCYLWWLMQGSWTYWALIEINHSLLMTPLESFLAYSLI